MKNVFMATRMNRAKTVSEIVAKQLREAILYCVNLGYDKVFLQVMDDGHIRVRPHAGEFSVCDIQTNVHSICPANSHESWRLLAKNIEAMTGITIDTSKFSRGFLYSDGYYVSLLTPHVVYR